MTPILLDRTYNWSCPNCDQTLVTKAPRPFPQHRCRGLKGLFAPLHDAAEVVKVEAVERGDYVNGDHPQTDAEGRPIMAIVTTRDDGQDCAVLAPTASTRSNA